MESETHKTESITRVSDRPAGTGRKIICIGECALDIIFDGDMPVGAMPGGRVINAAALLAADNYPVYMIGEAGKDPVGEMVIDKLVKSGVNIDGIDRFTDGHTPVNIFTSPSGEDQKVMDVSRYDDYPAEGFDVVWPRIDRGDIVVVGGYYALSPRNRGRLSQFLSYLAERKAIVVYLPGYLSVQEPRITRIMPAILENLEYSNVIVSRNQDLELIFGVSDPEESYRRHISFYCRSLINIDPAAHTISYYSGENMAKTDVSPELVNTMMWNAGAVAGIIKALYDSDTDVDDLDPSSVELMNKTVSSSASAAHATASSLKLKWQLHN